MPPGALIDLSSENAQRNIYKHTAETYGLTDEDYGIARRWSTGCKEVLAEWRGDVPMEYCDVVDECDEHTSLGKVSAFLVMFEKNDAISIPLQLRISSKKRLD